MLIMGLKRKACSETSTGVGRRTRTISPPSPVPAPFPLASHPGLLIQQVIFFICFAAFTFLVVIPLQSGTSSYLFKVVRNMW